MKKKINIDRDPISNEEITTRMNFNQLLSNFPGYINLPFYKTGWFITTVASVAVLVTVTTTLILNNNKEEITSKKELAHAAPPSNELEAISYSEDTPCVTPPIKHLDIQSDSYYCANDAGGEFTHSSGSKIVVPKNAFVDKNGNSLNGEIELRYREFHDPIDFILSGIPMTYDSAGTEYTFESAGMIEVYGYQNGKPVEIAEEKSIRIEMNPKDGSSRFNLYELDSKSGDWTYSGKPELIFQDVDESTGKIASQEDDYHLLVRDDIDQEETKTVALKNEVETTKTELKQTIHEVVSHKKTEPSKPKTSVNKNRQFDLDVDPKDFPELKNYSNLLFEVEQNDKNFSPEVYNIEWEDISLSEKTKGVSYYLTLSKGNTKTTFSVHPVFSGADFEKAVAEFEQKFSVYEKELEKRVTQEEKVREKLKKQMELYENILAEENKKKAEYEANLTASFEQSKDLNKNLIGIHVVARAFEVTQFGTWNCDSPISKPSGQKVQASFLSTNGIDLELHHVNLIEKNKNAVFTYNSDRFQNFKFNPKEENTIVAFTHNNELAIIKPIYFKNMPKENKHQFKMEIIDVNSMTVKNVKEKLNL